LPLELHTDAGSLERVVMTQGEPKLGPKLNQVGPLAKALGISSRDITATRLRPQISSTGVPSLQVPIRDVGIVREMAPDFSALGRVLARFRGNPGAYVFAFGAEGPADLHARGFFPGFGIPEDPATGSAAGACGAYLAANARLPGGDSF